MSAFRKLTYMTFLWLFVICHLEADTLKRQSDSKFETFPTEISTRVGNEIKLELPLYFAETNFEVTDLPEGLQYDPENLLISGTLLTPGKYISLLKIFGEVASEKTITFQIEDLQPEFDLPTSISATQNQFIQIKIQAINDISEFEANGLPKGLKINNKGIIDGIPSTSGDFQIKITATNQFGRENGKYTKLIIKKPESRLLSDNLLSGRISEPFQSQIEASRSPIHFSITNLPQGLSINDETGLISGTPEIIGKSVATLKITNRYDCTSTFEIEFDIGKPHKHAWDDAEDMGDGWFKSDWFGMFQEITDEILFHKEHGWIYYHNGDRNGVFFWDYGLNSRMWTSASHYPWFYIEGNYTGWACFVKGTVSPNRKFYLNSDDEKRFVMEAELR